MRVAAAEVWSFPIPLTLVLILTAWLYFRGWLCLRKTTPKLVRFPHLVTFVAGCITVWVATGSPLAALDHKLLSAHMIQHILLMAVAAPLILISSPVRPLLRGLPKGVAQRIPPESFRSLPLRGVGRTLTHPAFCWFAATVTVIGWHVPALFELGLHSDRWHAFRQLTFFAAGLLFWWPVIPSWRNVSRTHGWSSPLYLFLATLPCDALSAFLTFCDRVVYRSYMDVRGPLSISPLQDQEWAGVLMWVFVTFIYMTPAVLITVRILSPRRLRLDRDLASAGVSPSG
jgi:putative membrane protein